MKDANVYGLFPKFVLYIDRVEIAESCNKLKQMDNGTATKIVASIPDDWHVSSEARSALVSFIVQRAAYVADTMITRLAEYCWPPKEQDLFKE